MFIEKVCSEIGKGVRRETTVDIFLGETRHYSPRKMPLFLGNNA
jgi:hypothetical protein